MGIVGSMSVLNLLLVMALLVATIIILYPWVQEVLAFLYNLPLQWERTTNGEKRLSYGNLVWNGFMMCLLYGMGGAVFAFLQIGAGWIVGNVEMTNQAKAATLMSSFLGKNLIYGGLIGISTVAIARIVSVFHSRFIVSRILYAVILFLSLAVIQYIVFPKSLDALTDEVIKSINDPHYTQQLAVFWRLPFLSLLLFLFVECGIGVKNWCGGEVRVPLSNMHEVISATIGAKLRLYRKNVERLYCDRIRQRASADNYLTVSWVSASTSDVIFDELSKYADKLREIRLVAPAQGCKKALGKIPASCACAPRVVEKSNYPRFMLINEKEVIIAVPAPYRGDGDSSNIAWCTDDPQTVAEYRCLFTELFTNRSVPFEPEKKPSI